VLTLSRERTVFELGPATEPVATINPGERMRLETAWPLGIRMRSLADPRPPRQLPITGPIAVRGAEPGDALRVTIHAIELPDWGKVWTAPWLGVLTPRQFVGSPANGCSRDNSAGASPHVKRLGLRRDPTRSPASWNASNGRGTLRMLHSAPSRDGEAQPPSVPAQ
jgi:acetamidase/formamidase